MKTRALLKSSIAFFIITVMILFSCEKDNKNDNIPATKNFSVQLIDGYNMDYAWVILHNLDGTEVINYKKIVGEEVAEFGEVSDEEITATMIRVDTTLLKSGTTEYYISITSDYNSPVGAWVFRSYGNSDQAIGEADITVNYPAEAYDNIIISTTDRSYSIGGSIPESSYNLKYDVNFLNDNNKFDVYSAVSNDNGGIYEWVSEDFNNDLTNYYNLVLSNILTGKMISTNKPINRFYIYGNQSSWKMDHLLVIKSMSNDPLTNFQFYTPDELPVDKIRLRFSIYDDQTSTYYLNSYSGFSSIPQTITIPDGDINGTVSSDGKQINNIQHSGNADQISANWRYEFDDPNGNGDIYWYVYTNFDSQSISLPVLPDEIINEFMGNTNNVFARSLSFSDMNTTSSHTDIINRFFIDNTPIKERYDEQFSYRRYFDSKNDPLDKEHDQELFLR